MGPALETPKTILVADGHESSLGGLGGLPSAEGARAKRSVLFFAIKMVKAAPTRPGLYYDFAVLKANPFFGTLRDVLLKETVTRPSTVAGSRYDEVSKAYFTAVRQTLIDQKSAGPAVQELEGELQRLLVSREP